MKMGVNYLLIFAIATTSYFQTACLGQISLTSAPSLNWQSIASSSDGTMLAATVYNGGTGGIYTSNNSGGSWMQTSAPYNSWVSIASSSDGTKLAAAAFNGGIYTSSSSGGSWMLTSAPSLYWISIASSSDGTKLAAVTYDGGIYTSSNSGGSWMLTSAPLNNAWQYIASSSDGTKLAATVGGNGGVGGIYTSNNSGGSWMLTSAPYNNSWVSIASSSDGTKLAAGAFNGSIYTSNDSGGSWMLTSAPYNENWQSIASSSDGTKLAAVVDGGGIYTSSNSGGSWIMLTSAPSSLNWYSIASSSDGTKLAAVVDGGGIYCSLPLSPYNLYNPPFSYAPQPSPPPPPPSPPLPPSLPPSPPFPPPLPPDSSNLSFLEAEFIPLVVSITIGGTFCVAIIALIWYNRAHARRSTSKDAPGPPGYDVEERNFAPAGSLDHGRPPSPPIFQHENPSAPPLPSTDEIEVLRPQQLPPLHPDHYYNLPPPASEGPQQDIIECNTCKICMDAPATFGFLHEGSTHLCACRNCAEGIVQSGGTCPVCRKVVEQIIQVFPV